MPPKAGGRRAGTFQEPPDPSRTGETAVRPTVVPALLTGPLTVTRIAAEGEGEVRDAVVGSPVRKMARADSDVEPMEPRLLPARALEARPPDAVAAPPARDRGGAPEVPGAPVEHRREMGWRQP